MTDEQIKRLSNQLLDYIDTLLQATDATPVETDALYKIASVLVELAKIN